MSQPEPSLCNIPSLSDDLTLMSPESEYSWYTKDRQVAQVNLEETFQLNISRVAKGQFEALSSGDLKWKHPSEASGLDTTYFFLPRRLKSVFALYKKALLPLQPLGKERLKCENATQELALFAQKSEDDSVKNKLKKRMVGGGRFLAHNRPAHKLADDPSVKLRELSHRQSVFWRQQIRPRYD